MYKDECNGGGRDTGSHLKGGTNCPLRGNATGGTGGWALITAFGVEEKKSLIACIVLNIFLVER
ncbi:hypothetical protein KDA_44630 [Dictyobacter alpinus]|uniref:Uncharacterized protein n=1 Tax=Dictyobacter alpinus TaxID=2014873 RepID=A0A402BCA9_9CHLR|nr:hypothetical protein KDA_44630 [Dictyobacter alpinus]